jgi:hypothetical protein
MNSLIKQDIYYYGTYLSKIARYRLKGKIKKKASCFGHLGTVVAKVNTIKIFN